MALVINEAGASPVAIDMITIERHGKASCVPFRVGSLHELLFYRVRNLDGNIVRYAFPDAYFVTLIRMCLQQLNDAESTNDFWGDSIEDLDTISDAYAIKLARAKANRYKSSALLKIIANRDHANDTWNARRKEMGLVLQDVTLQDPFYEDSDASEDEYNA